MSGAGDAPGAAPRPPQGRHRGAEVERRRSPVIVLVAIIAVGAVVLGGVALVGALSGGIRDRPAASPSAPPCESTTPLTVLAAQGQAPLLARLGKAFSARHRDEEGGCIAVAVVAQPSGAAERLLEGEWPASEGPPPDVWVPASSVWLDLLADRRDGQALVPEEAPSLAQSPVVVAMPRPKAYAIGWPTQAIGWDDLLGLARDGWGSRGQPQFSPFGLGKTDPERADTGVLGTLASFAAAGGGDDALEVADLDTSTARAFVGGLEQAVVRYGDDETAFLEAWREGEGAAGAAQSLSALVTTEQVVAAFTRGVRADGTAGERPETPLVAVYPEEGTFVADHPYAVLDAPWVTAAKRDAAAAFLADLQSDEGRKAFAAAGYRDARGATALGEADGVLPDQPATVLPTPEPAVVDAALTDWEELRKTARVLNLIDVSESMDETIGDADATKLEGATTAATDALGLFTGDDEVGLWSFSQAAADDRDHEELVPVGPMREVLGDGERRTVLARELAGLEAEGGTGLYNSLAAAYRQMQDDYAADRVNAVVVLTDGRNDRPGGETLDDLLALVERDPDRPVRVITIAYGPDADTATLARIAEATGGASYEAPTTQQVPEAYERAVSNL